MSKLTYPKLYSYLWDYKPFLNSLSFLYPANIGIHTHTHTHMASICIHVHSHVYTHIYIICIYVCMYSYIHTYMYVNKSTWNCYFMVFRSHSFLLPTNINFFLIMIYLVFGIERNNCVNVFFKNLAVNISQDRPYINGNF